MAFVFKFARYARYIVSFFHKQNAALTPPLAAFCAARAYFYAAEKAVCRKKSITLQTRQLFIKQIYNLTYGNNT